MGNPFERAIPKCAVARTDLLVLCELRPQVQAARGLVLPVLPESAGAALEPSHSYGIGDSTPSMSPHCCTHP